MFALKIVGGLAFFIPLFVGVGLGVGKLTEKHRTGLSLLLLGAGLAAILVLVTAYGHAVR